MASEYQTLKETPGTAYGSAYEEITNSESDEDDNSDDVIVSSVRHGVPLEHGDNISSSHRNLAASVTDVEGTVVSVYHCHTKLKSGVTKSNEQARKVLTQALFICIAFMICEIIGGFWANSLAIMSDAAHLLTDCASFLISLFSLYIATQKPSRKMSFGWHRAEVFGALISVQLIWVITTVLVFFAVERVNSAEYEINAPIMLITAGLGICVNILFAFYNSHKEFIFFMGAILHYGGHTHSHAGVAHSHGHSHGGGRRSDPETAAESDHGHSHGAAADAASHSHSHSHAPSHGHSHGEQAAQHQHQHQKKKGRQHQNINVRAAFLHVLTDLMQSIGVFIAALVIFFKPEWKIADPICTFIFAILVVVSTTSISRDVVHVLMEGTPVGLSFTDVMSSLSEIEGVAKVHNLRVWALTMEKTAVSVHLTIADGANAQRVLRHASIMLDKKYGVFESTIQIEKFREDLNECDKCQPIL